MPSHRVDHHVRTFVVEVRSIMPVGADTIKDLIQKKHEVLACQETRSRQVLEVLEPVKTVRFAPDNPPKKFWPYREFMKGGGLRLELSTEGYLSFLNRLVEMFKMGGIHCYDGNHVAFEFENGPTIRFSDWSVYFCH